MLPISDCPQFEAIAEVAKRALLAPETWHCNRPYINLKTTIDVPLLGTVIEQNGDGCQEGRQELIKKDGGEMLVSIVLDRPLAEAKALVNDPDRLSSEISTLLSNQSQWQAHPLLSQMANPDVRDDMPIAHFTARSSSGFGPVEAPRKQKCHKLAFSKQATLPGLPTRETHDWWSLYVSKRGH